MERFPQSLIWSYSIVITPITHIRVRLMALYITSTFIVLYKIWCQFHWISKSADLTQHLKCSHSLPNISNQIRWALDLRWQRPDQPFGLYGLKDGLLLRKDGKTVEPDWEKFESVDRTTVQKKSVEGFVDVIVDEEFDTTIQGPWMKKWQITHMNTHTDAHERAERKWRINLAIFYVSENPFWIIFAYLYWL